VPSPGICSPSRSSRCSGRKRAASTRQRLLSLPDDHFPEHWHALHVFYEPPLFRRRTLLDRRPRHPLTRSPSTSRQVSTEHWNNGNQMISNKQNQPTKIPGISFPSTPHRAHKAAKSSTEHWNKQKRTFSSNHLKIGATLRLTAT
jgi:hypothetical protein